MPEVPAGADLAALLLAAVERGGERLAEGDVVVVSSKVVSKALGLWAEADAAAPKKAMTQAARPAQRIHELIDDSRYAWEI